MARPKQYDGLKAVPICLDEKDRDRMTTLAGHICGGNKSELIRQLLAEKADQMKLDQIEQLETQRQEVESRKASLTLEFNKAEAQAKEISEKKELCMHASKLVLDLKNRLTKAAVSAIAKAPSPERKYDLAVIHSQLMCDRGIKTTAHELLAMSGEDNTKKMFG